MSEEVEKKETDKGLSAVDAFNLIVDATAQYLKSMFPFLFSAMKKK